MRASAVLPIPGCPFIRTEADPASIRFDNSRISCLRPTTTGGATGNVVGILMVAALPTLLTLLAGKGAPPVPETKSVAAMGLFIVALIIFAPKGILGLINRAFGSKTAKEAGHD